MRESVLYKCRCGRLSDDREEIIRHVEEIHGAEFNIRSLYVLEDALRRVVTPSPIDD